MLTPKTTQAVEALSETCIELGVSVPVGKDSTSMKASWKDKEEEKNVTSPISLVISAFAPVDDG